MSELKPYFIRAVYDWCCDNGFTAHIVAHVNPYTRVPLQFVQNNEIVLNIGMNACQNLILGNDFIEFSARFGGKAFDISIPVGHIISIFARENGEGMGFEVHPYMPADNEPEIPSKEERLSDDVAKSGLKIVKKQEKT